MPCCLILLQVQQPFFIDSSKFDILVISKLDCTCLCPLDVNHVCTSVCGASVASSIVTYAQVDSSELGLIVRPELRTTVFSHSQTVVVCPGCQTVLCQPTGGKARLTEGCSFRRKGD